MTKTKTSLVGSFRGGWFVVEWHFDEEDPIELAKVRAQVATPEVLIELMKLIAPVAAAQALKVFKDHGIAGTAEVGTMVITPTQ